MDDKEHYPPTVDFGPWARDYAKYRKVHPKVLPSLIEGARLGKDSRVLEVGCGTGNYIAAISEATGCRVWGVDVSEEMLKVARERIPDAVLRLGKAEAPGFDDSYFDFIFTVDVIHLVTGKEAHYHEARRMLGPGGMICTVTDDAEIIRRREPLSNYFPETMAFEFQRYPRDGELARLMVGAGFTEIREEKVLFQESTTDISTWKSRSSSCLRLIPDEAFARGKGKTGGRPQEGAHPPGVSICPRLGHETALALRLPWSAQGPERPAGSRGAQG